MQDRGTPSATPPWAPTGPFPHATWPLSAEAQRPVRPLIAAPPAAPGPAPSPQEVPPPPQPPAVPETPPPEIDDPQPPDSPVPVREPPAMPPPMAVWIDGDRPSDTVLH